MHRDLNDIIPPSRRRQMGDVAMPPSSGPSMDMRPQAPRYTPPPVVEEQRVAVPPMPPVKKRLLPSGGFPYGTALITVVVVAICALVLYAFAGAKVTITPVMNDATVDGTFTATLSTGDLPFQIVTVEKTATANVPAESTVTANDPATGKIIITNRQTNAQALIKNTRFQTPGGQVFRIRDSISVPAGGSLTVDVYADEAGDKYNIGPATFTIPGLKGSKAYDQVTAKSDAGMTGGFSGERPSVAQATKDKQYADMQSKIAGELDKALSAKIPANYVLVPGASVTSYAPTPDAAGASGTVTLGEKGTIVAVVFPVDALARTIASKSVGTYGGQPVTLKDVKSLTVKPTAALSADLTTFDFALSGATTVIWQVDQSKISGAVAGKTRDAAEIALKSFPEVSKAVLVLRPFWSSHYPGDPTKIKVIVVGQAPSK